LLPRRNPGSSGITEVPAPPAEQLPRRQRRELATPWWENAPKPAPAPAPQPAAEPKPEAKPAPARAASNTSAFFAARPREAAPDPIASIPAPKAAASPADDDVIYRRMISEMLGDPHDLVNSPDLDWQTVWDRGWTLAAAAEEKPVEAHTTDHGLPVRTPGARLIPGGANGRLAEQDEPVEAEQRLNGTSGSHRQPQHAATGAVARDPEAVRASFSSHFGGVRTGRSHARDNTNQGPDQQ
jgi:hypothetical protein